MTRPCSYPGCEQPGDGLARDYTATPAATVPFCVEHADQPHVRHHECGQAARVTMCGACEGVWCDRCDPAHGPLCPWCHGRGYSTAAIREPRHRQANHVLHNGGHPVQELHRAGLGVGHVWTAVDCPAYRSLDGADCTCLGASLGH